MEAPQAPAPGAEGEFGSKDKGSTTSQDTELIKLFWCGIVWFVLLMRVQVF